MGSAANARRGGFRMAADLLQVMGGAEVFPDHNFHGLRWGGVVYVVRR